MLRLAVRFTQFMPGFFLLICALAPVCEAQTVPENQVWWEMKTPGDVHVVIYELEALSVDGLKQVIGQLCEDKDFCKIDFWTQREFAPWSEEAIVARYNRFGGGDKNWLRVKCWAGIAAGNCGNYNDYINVE